jgi:PAS domain S-box-containing protein
VNRILLVCIALCLAILVFDANTPIGYAEWMLYLLPISLAFWRLRQRQLVYVASLTIFFLGLGAVFSPPGVIPWEVALFNRATGAIVVSLTAFAFVQFKRRNEAQRESEEKYRALAENSPNFVGVLQDGVLKYVNRTAVERFGWTYDELVSPSFNPVERVVAERFRGLINENIIKRLRGENTPPYEISVTARDGSEIPVILQAARITYQGRPAVEFAMGDITERKQMENRLASLHEHSLRLSSATTMDEVVEHTLNAMERALGFGVAEFSVVQEGRIRITGSRGRRFSLPEQSLHGQGIAVKAVNTKMPVLVPDSRAEEAYVDYDGRTRREASHVMLSELAVPVLVDGEPAAVLNVESQTVNAFTMMDQQLLETLSNHVAAALKRLKQEEELKALAKFPLEHPSPVLRASQDGTLLYANDASNRLLQLWGANVGGTVPEFWQGLIHGALATGLSSTIDAVVDDLVYAMYIVPVRDLGYVNLYGQDITERKQIEEKLRENEERFRKIFAEGPSGMALVRPDYRFARVNKAFCTMLGYSEEELTTLKFTDITHPEDIKLGVELTQKLFRGEIPSFSVEKRYIKKNGEVLPAELTASYIRDRQGTPMYSVAMIEDITERKQMEKELSRSNQFLGSVIDNAYVWLNVLDNEQSVLVWNRAAEAMSGYSREEVVGHERIWDWLYPDQEYRKQITETVNDILQSRRTDVDVETKIRRKDGHTRIISWNERALTDQDGKTIGTIAIGHDITERKKMEQELRRYSENLEQLVSERTKELNESDERYRQLLASMSEHIAVLDSELRYVLVNDALTRSFNIQREQLLGKKLTEVFPGIEKTAFFEAVQHVLKSRVSTSVIDAHRFEDGGTGWFEIHIYPVAKGIMYVATDITERKQMEERLLRSERLAAIGETAAMVGHDLRNPLQGIVGALHLLRQEPLKPNERDEMLQLIQRNIEYSDAIVRDLSEYSGEIHLELAETTPKSITREAAHAVKAPAKVIMQNHSQDHPALRVDPSRIRRVLINLIENAAEAMPEGGTVTITSRQWNNTAEIAISDTGSGMPARVMENLWKPLQTTKAKGMGLGLAICKRIVEAHGGNISVKSEVGEGTTVTIRLPLNLAVAEVKQK